MNVEHHYTLAVEWTGNRGTGTSGYRAYGRDHVIRSDGKPELLGSSDKPFYGDADRWNPEELLLAALSQCHMLSYLHVAFTHGIVVTGYTDEPTGTMMQTEDGGGHFTSVTLRPRVIVAEPSDIERANELHAEASRKCFIASSVNFPVGHEPEAVAEPTRP
jgi:organic hydroperoxide reductase OsmC/OhrA